MTTAPSGVVPVEIGRANQHDVKIVWQDGHESIYPARELRLKCPCAQCVDEISGKVLVVASAVSGDVHPLSIELVGRYAITIQWSDGHHTGIYSFELLRRLCPCAECRPQSSCSGEGGGCSSTRCEGS